MTASLRPLELNDQSNKLVGHRIPAAWALQLLVPPRMQPPPSRCFSTHEQSLLTQVAADFSKKNPPTSSHLAP